MFQQIQLYKYKYIIIANQIMILASTRFHMYQNLKLVSYKSYIVGNKAKGRISKRVFQEKKTRQIFRKTNFSYPLICTRTYAYQGARNVRFWVNLACFVFLKHPFRDSPFCLITDDIAFRKNSFLNSSSPNGIAFWNKYRRFGRLVKRFSWRNPTKWKFSEIRNYHRRYL